MTDLAAARARVARICVAAADARSLRLMVLDELRKTIGFDAHAWLLTDPETTVGCAPLADVPCLPRLPALIRLKYLTEVNRWTSLDAPARLHHTTGGDLSRSALWRDLLSHHDVTDIASAAFADRFGCWGFLDLWRCGGSPFTAADAAFLAGVGQVVTEGLRRCQAHTFAATPAASVHPAGPVVLLLSPGIEVLGETPATQDYLRVLVPPEAGRTPIPAGAYNVAAQLLAVEADVDRHPPVARVHLAGGRWVTLRAARIGENIAVTIEETSPAARVTVFTRAFGLSARETELLGHLVRGAGTREVAARMFLSEHTVQDHLKSIFAKTAARSRRTLLARVLGGGDADQTGTG